MYGNHHEAHRGQSDGGWHTWHILLSHNSSSWLPSLWAGYCWSTPTLMASDNKQLWGITVSVSPSNSEQIWRAGVSSSNTGPSLSGKDSWQFSDFVPRKRGKWARCSRRYECFERSTNNKITHIKSQVIAETRDCWHSREAEKQHQEK